MTFIGEQGPFDDAIAGVTDSSGWFYSPAVQGVPSIGWEGVFCWRCGEQMTEGEHFEVLCWSCDDPVPAGWEHLHDDALQFNVGILSAHSR